MAALRRWLFAGLLVLAPLGITLWVLQWIIGTLDQTLLILPDSWQPDRLIGHRIPGLGVLLALAILLTVGAITSNIVGRKLVEWSDALLHRIPVVRSIYSSVKQVSDTLFSPSRQRLPHRGAGASGRGRGSGPSRFVTGTPGGDVATHLRRRFRQRLRADHAQPHGRLLRAAAPQGLRRAEDERRRGAHATSSPWAW